jgi:hypothetical protein
MFKHLLDEITSGTGSYDRLSPIAIEVTDQLIIIDGLKFSRQIFHVLAKPDPEKLYRITKREDVVYFETVQP